MARIFRPCAEPLEGRALLSAVIAETEPNNRAAAADVVRIDDGPATIRGKTSGRDRDFFLVPVSETGPMSMVLQVRGRTRVAFSITDTATGRTLFDGSVRSGLTVAKFDASAGSTLSVRISGARPRVTPYVLVVSPTDPGGPEVIAFGQRGMNRRMR